MNWQNKIFSLMVQNQAASGDGGGAGGAASGYGTDEGQTTTTPPPAAQAAGSNNQPPANPPASSGASNPPPAAGAGAANGNQQGNQEDVTGYGGATPPPPAANPPPANEPAKLEIDLKGFAEDSPSVKYVRERASILGLNKEQAQKLMDAEKADFDNYSKAQEKKVADAATEKTQRHQTWEKELRDDPDFGGDNFAQNVHQVNKMVNDHFPSIKKRLTDNKERLEPSVMRELANVAKKLYAEGNVVNGGAGSGNQEKHSPLDYYTKKKT